MNTTKADHRKALRAARAAMDAAAPSGALPAELARSGMNPTESEIRKMAPGLRERDYAGILWNLEHQEPVGRHARRARASVDRRRERSLEKYIERHLQWYEWALSILTKDGKAEYQRLLKDTHPHPEGRYAPDARDSAGIAEMKRSLWEIEVLRRFVSRSQRGMRRAA